MTIDIDADAKVAWRLAAGEARRGRQAEITPAHLLIGLCSLEKALVPGAAVRLGLDEAAAKTVATESHAVAEHFRAAGLEVRRFRRALRAGLGERGSSDERSPVHRNQACRRVFVVAGERAGLAGRPRLGVRDLLGAILETPDDVVVQVFEAQGCPLVAFRERVDQAVDSTVPAPADITGGVAAEAPVFAATGASTGEVERRLALLYELPLQFGMLSRLESLLQFIAERLVAVIPGATRAAVLVRDRQTGSLLLKAHLPVGRPSVSRSLVRKAMDERRGLVWSRGLEPTASQREHHIESGMYAPLVWNGEALGAICVDNEQQGAAFTDDDLRLLVAVAQHAAAAIAHREAGDDLMRQNVVLGRLLTNFSPRVRERLLAAARQGRLRLGGERSEITVLMADIRGFTRLSAGLDTDDVVDLLNDYLSSLVDVIFRHEGTVDKFVGDAIVAVFGSPVPDPAQHEHAVRAAMAMQQAAVAVSERRAARGLAVCDVGIGIDSGEVLHGFIGSNERMEFTVIGDAVNRAARFSDGAGRREVIVSPDVHQRVWHSGFQFEPVRVPTKHEGVLDAFRVGDIPGRSEA